MINSYPGKQKAQCFQYISEEAASNEKDAELLEAAAQWLRQHNDFTLVAISYQCSVSNYVEEKPEVTLRLYYDE